MTEQQQAADAVATYQAAVATFAATLSDPAVAEAIAPTLTCARATPIIDLLTEAGHHDAAQKWAELHAWTRLNDEHDPHRGDESDGWAD